VRVLLLDTAFAAAPVYDFLLSAGHEVWVAGNRETDLLARRAGAYWMNVNYSDVSAVEEAAHAAAIERVVPGCTDISLHSALQLSELQTSDGLETNSALADKGRFRDECKSLGIRAPGVIDASEFPREGRYICKPVDAYSGRGCSIFDGKDTQGLHVAMRAAIDASPSRSIVIEEFVDGQLHSCTGFIEGFQFVDTTYVVEGSSVNPYAVDTSYVTHDIEVEVRRELEGSLCRLARHLGLKNGLLHAQFILTDIGAYVIEVSRRCPGDLYPLLIEYSTGNRFAARYASYFTGDVVIPRSQEALFILRHTIASETQRVYAGVRYTGPMSIIAQFPILAMGAELREAQKSRAQVVFCQYDNLLELKTAYNRFMNREMYVFNC
jgi:hypothetical protein